MKNREKQTKVVTNPEGKQFLYTRYVGIKNGRKVATAWACEGQC